MHSKQDKQPALSSTPAKGNAITGIAAALLGVAAMGGLAWYLTHQSMNGTGPQKGPGGRRMPSTTVGVAAAERMDIPVIVEALGTVAARATATVRPQVSGVLKEVRYREGQMVTAGQILAVIDPRPFEIALAQASGQRQRDEAQLENAKLTLERYRTLLSQDSIAGQDVDTQAALVKQLQGTVAADRASERNAQLNLDYSRITAPISGRVGLRTVDVGNTVSSGDANGIAVITQTNPIDVQFSIPQDRIGELSSAIGEGASPSVTVLDRTRETTLGVGRFLAMDNQVDVQTGTVRAKAGFANDKNVLFPSQFVNVRMVLRTIPGAIVVPVNALRHGSNGDYVYVLNAELHTVSLRKVTRGVGMVDKVQVASGVKEGEQVITEGADRLKDGASVVLPGDKPKEGRRGGEHGGRNKGTPTDGAPTERSATGPNDGAVNREGGEHRRREGAEGTAMNGAAAQ